MKKILLLCLFLLCSCAQVPKETIEIVDNEQVIVETLPSKEDASNQMSKSPITPKNIDDYLFRDDCIYIDTRSPKQFYEEGSIAGFINIPFYGYICDFENNSRSLYTFKKDGDILLGDPGSFFANYEESDEIIKSYFPKDKNILVIATAGVESCYLLNLLEQLGYESDKLYNVGSFTTGMGSDISYIGNKDAKYLISPFYMDETTIDYHFENLTPIQ